MKVCGFFEIKNYFERLSKRCVLDALITYYYQQNPCDKNKQKRDIQSVKTNWSFDFYK